MGNIFEREINRSLRKFADQNLFYFRLFDTKSFRQISERIYALKQPCDFIAIYRGKIYFLELKSSRSKTSFAFRYIRKHQLESLLRAEKAGKPNVISLFLICNRSNKRNIRCYAVSAETINYLMQRGRKSVKWNELRGYAVELEREKGIWKLENLFDHNYKI